MNQDQLTSINKIVMYIWLAMAVLGVIATAIVYFKYGSENISTVIMITLISLMMFGWKKFQIAKFSSKDN